MAAEQGRGDEASSRERSQQAVETCVGHLDANASHRDRYDDQVISGVM